MKPLITPDQRFIFATQITVRSSDVNYGGHLGNDAVLTLMQEARLQFYQSLGFRNEISFEGTIGQIIAEVNVQYKAEAFMGDNLTFDIGIDNMAKYGFDMIYRIVNKNNEKEVAVGITRNLCFDYSTRKIASIPTALSGKLKKFLYDDTRSSTTS